MSSWEQNITCDHCGYEDEDPANYPPGLVNDGDTAGWSCPACGIVHTVSMCVEATFRAVPGYSREFGIAS